MFVVRRYMKCESRDVTRAVRVNWEIGQSKTGDKLMGRHNYHLVHHCTAQHREARFLPGLDACTHRLLWSMVSNNDV